jgi:hypothetical protein
VEDGFEAGEVGDFSCGHGNNYGKQLEIGGKRH